MNWANPVGDFTFEVLNSEQAGNALQKAGFAWVGFPSGFKANSSLSPIASPFLGGIVFFQNGTKWLTLGASLDIFII